MKVGLIIGTGLDSIAESAKWSEVSTPYGPASLSSSTLGGKQVALLRRHGPMLNVPPHLINYHANIWALKELGVESIIATAAVGSLRTDTPPGSLAVVDDFIDFTKHRSNTIFDKVGDRVVHVDFTSPYCPMISKALHNSAATAGFKMSRPVTYLCVDGPRYETPAEIRMFSRWGADVVGMTGVPEVIFAREMGICYGTIAMISNFAAGISERPLSHQEVVAAVLERCRDVERIIQGAIAVLPDDRKCCQ